MKISLSDGIIVGSLASAAAGIEMSFSNVLLVHFIGLFVVLAAIISFLINLRVVDGKIKVGEEDDEYKNKNKGERLVYRLKGVKPGVLFAALLVGISVYSVSSTARLIYRQRPIFIRTEFQNSYADNHQALGDVEKTGNKINNNRYFASVYQANFGGGTILWDDDSQSQTILLDNPRGNNTFSVVGENEPERKWFIEPSVRNELGILPNFPAPYGGTARWLADRQNKDQKEHLGNMSWHCLYNGSYVFRQNFKNGFIFGPVRSEHPGGEPGGTIYAFIYGNDHQHGRWVPGRAPGVGPPCKPVWYGPTAINQSHAAAPSALR